MPKGSKKSVVWLEDVRSKDVPLVGGKGASLGEMINVDLPVPPGFAVTATAFREFINEAGITKKLFKSLEVDVDDNKELRKAEKNAKELVLSMEPPKRIKNDIAKAYEELCKREGEEVFVAVRSSATAEDLPDASFAGQQDTFLNIRGSDELLDAVRKCWASLYGARAIFYRVKQGFEHESVNISVIVQKMANADEAGVMFTSHPSTGDKQAIIEAAWGLGETVVSGSVSPDQYVVDRESKKIVSTTVAIKNIMTIKDPKTGKTVEKPVPKNNKEKKVLSDQEILDIAKMGDVVEEHYGIPQDVEWAIEDGKIYMLQSRPITTIQERKEETAKEDAGTGEIILQGLGASPGSASGKVRIVQDVSKDLDKVRKGDILVAEMTTPDMVPAMKLASGIVTDEGGLTCHAAIVSRELGVPAVVGTRKATETLQDDDEISLDGEKGIVYRGIIKREEPEARAGGAAPSMLRAKLVTATEVKVNVSIPEVARRAAATGADGVGLLRIEHMILGLNEHPASYMKSGREDEYVSELVQGIKQVADVFFPKPVWVRTMDAPTDEFRSTKGGEDEPVEANPMLGWRGIRRDLTSVDHFKLEIRAFKELIEMGFTNVGIMLPLVQHPSELRLAKEIMLEEGLDLENIDLGIMVETPASALIVDEFIKEGGLDFISFGTNDLTQYTLAVDRNNENVANLFTEHHPAILKLIEYVIAECNKAGVQSSICGQAGSDPKMVGKLIRMGITSISANIDAVEAVREMVARTEKRILLDAEREARKN